MNAQEMLTMISIFLGFFALVFGVVYMHKKENLAMIEKGMNPKERSNRPIPTPYKNLKWGLLLAGSGVGLLVAFMIDHNMIPHRGEDAAPIYFSLIAIGGGLGLVGSYFAEKKELEQQRREDKTL